MLANVVIPLARSSTHLGGSVEARLSSSNGFCDTPCVRNES